VEYVNVQLLRQCKETKEQRVSGIVGVNIGGRPGSGVESPRRGTATPTGQRAPKRAARVMEAA